MLSTGPWLRALALAFAALTAACSSDRWIRISPLSGESSPDRINLWPFFYSDGGATSVLWPFFDVDQEGFAARPFFATEDGTWSVLYPLSHFEGDQGWFFPFFQTEFYTGAFPIAHFGALSYIGPYWWRPEAGDRGLFPLAYLSDGLNYVGPAWWIKGGGTELDGGLFPIATFGSFNHVGTLWWLNGSPGWGLFPLFGIGRTKHVGPVWWSRDDQGSLSGGLFPLLHSDPASHDFAFHPFYAKFEDREGRSVSRSILLGLGHSSRTPRSEVDWLLPLYYSRTARDSREHDRVVVPLFWTRARGSTESTFTLLGHRISDSRGTKQAIYPLWWSRTRTGAGESSWQTLFPFFHSSRSGTARHVITPLGGWGWDADGTEYLNVLGPLFHHSRNTDGSRRRTAFLWPLYDRLEDGDMTRTSSIPFFSTTRSDQGQTGWYALGLGHHAKRGEERAHRFWPLYSHSEQAAPDTLYDLTLYQSRRVGDRSSTQLFPFFASRRTAGSHEVDVLLGLGNYRRSGTTKSWTAWPFASRAEGAEHPGLAYDWTLVGSSQWDSGHRFHIGGPLLYSSETRSDPERTARRRRVLLLYTSEWEELSSDSLPHSDHLHPINRVSHRKQSFLFDAFVNQSESFRVWRTPITRQETESVRAALAQDRPDLSSLELARLERARDLFARNGADVGPEREDLRHAAENFVTEESELRHRRRLRVPLLYSYERTDDEVRQSGPLWLFQSKSEPGSSKFSLLYYLYRSETRAGHTRRDIFPFITADTSAEHTKFTFLWRLLHYERHGDRRGGHILFIPWGKR